MNDILIGTIIGGAISITTTYLNNRFARNSMILEKKLSVYQNISETIIEEKLRYDFTIGEITLIIKTIRENPTKENEYSEKLLSKINCLHDIYTNIYSLFKYSYFLDEKISFEITTLYELLVKVTEAPELQSDKTTVKKIETAFENILSSLAESLGIKTKISIKNRNRLIKSITKQSTGPNPPLSASS